MAAINGGAYNHSEGISVEVGNLGDLLSSVFADAERQLNELLDDMKMSGRSGCIQLIAKGL